METTASPLGALILLGIVMFIVYRILLAIDKQTKEQSGETSEERTPTLSLPDRGLPTAPDTVTLSAITDSDNPFDGIKYADEAREILVEKSGFTLIGTFAINEMPGIKLQAYTLPETSLVGLIYCNTDGESWLNLITEYTDGRVITTSSFGGKNMAPRPRGMPLFNHPGMPPEQLLRRHRLEIRYGEKNPMVTAETFEEFFRKNYARLREFLLTQDTAPKEDERGNRFSLPPIPFPSLSREDENGDYAPSVFTLKKWFDKICQSVPVEKDRLNDFKRGLIWVTDGAGGASIARTISKYTGAVVSEVEGGRIVIRSGSGSAEDIIDPAGADGAELFDKINAALPSTFRYRKLSEVKVKGVTFYNRM